MVVEGGAIELTVEQRGAAIDDAAADHARGVRRILDHRFQIALPLSASSATVFSWSVT